MTLLLRSLTTLVVGWLLLLSPAAVFAQAKVPPAQIRFDSLTAIYHLSRDKKGLSLLTTEETIVADFPGNASYYGITRSIPKNYQNHSVNVKVLGVFDAAGDVIPFKTSTDTNDNIVVTTGDPSITLYGSQTIKIRYQTSGVVNIKNKSDEFLLNVNGRGWNQPISKIDATLYVPTSFNAELKNAPSCYLALGTTISKECEISTKKSANESVVSSKAVNVAAHQALVMKLDFAPSTFANSKGFNFKLITLSLSLLVILGAGGLYFLRPKRKQP
jgi:hypothetical protein